jgi:acetoin utilization deacetylase AcuC-like enzyme
MSLAYITHQQCHQHAMGAHHPEQPARLDAINDRLIASSLMMMLSQYDAPLASREQLLRVHDADYVDRVFARSPSDGLTWLDGDTAMNPFSLDAALRAAGANILAVDLVMSGASNQAFCAVRPPGHHAERHKAMGFCFFNNIAVAAAHAIAEHGLKRVAIVDFDVHHGNGTENIFSGNDSVLFCSSFQHPFYPNTGYDTDVSNIVNAPLPAGTDGASFREAITASWLPAIDAFAPELILISAGFDGHREDPMAQFNLLEFDYAWITRELMKLADKHAGGRAVSSLEGGYHLHALARSVSVHLQALTGALD